MKWKSLLMHLDDDLSEKEHRLVGKVYDLMMKKVLRLEDKVHALESEKKALIYKIGIITGDEE